MMFGSVCWARFCPLSKCRCVEARQCSLMYMTGTGFGGLFLLLHVVRQSDAGVYLTFMLRLVGKVLLDPF